MELMTKELEQRFAKVGSQEKIKDPIVVAKYFNPTGRATWLCTEYDPITRNFFGYASLFNEVGMNEWGYVNLDELEEVKLSFGLTIERDLYCDEMPMSKAKEINGIV